MYRLIVRPKSHLARKLSAKSCRPLIFELSGPGMLVDGQEALVGVEGEVPGVVVGEVAGGAAVADDEELEEAEQRLRVAVAGIVLVLDDLLDRPAGGDVERLELDLYDGHAVDEQQHVVAVVAVVGVDPQLTDDLEGVSCTSRRC